MTTTSANILIEDYDMRVFAYKSQLSDFLLITTRRPRRHKISLVLKYLFSCRWKKVPPVAIPTLSAFI